MSKRWTSTGWQRPIGCLEMQISFRKRAIDDRALLRKMTCIDQASCGSLAPCSGCCGVCSIQMKYTYVCLYTNEVYIYVFIYKLSIHIYVQIQMKYTYICLYASIHSNSILPRCIYVYTYRYVYMYIYVYVYI